MHGSDRGEQSAARLIGTILVAVLGIGAYWAMFYSAGFGSGYNERKAQVEAKHYASDTANQIDRECRAIAGEAARKCIAEIVKAERESQRGESDLAAQWKAADWVMWAGIFAGAQLLATAFGLYFVKRTLDATLEAVEDTGKATEAMREANRIAAESQRPWLQIELGNAKIFAMLVDEQVMVHVFPEIIVRNTGTRPAVNIKRLERVFRYVQPKGSEHAKFFAAHETYLGAPVATMPPNGSRSLGLAGTHTMPANLINEKEVFCYSISIVYSDGLTGEKRQTAQAYLLGKTVHVDGTFINGFTSAELFAPPKPKPGEGTVGRECATLQLPDNIMT